MIPVFLESPYSPNVPKNHPDFSRLLARNLAYARAAAKDCLARDESPYASHLLLTQEGILDDTVLEERVLGINAGRVWAQFAEKVVVYVDLGISPGMVMRLTHARAVGQPVEERSLPAWVQPVPIHVSRCRDDVEALKELSNE